MKLASGFYVCALFGWLTVGAQVSPTSNASNGAPSPQRVSSGLLSPVASAAGELPTPASRNDIQRQLDQTEHALNAIKRPLNDEEQKSADAIHSDITLARKALIADDLDGASTLSGKAHALLLHLNKKDSEQKPHVLLID